MRTLIIALIFFSITSFAQESKWGIATSYFRKIEQRKVPKYLSFIIRKNESDNHQYKLIGYIEIYKDSLIYHKFWEEPDGIIRSNTVHITDKSIIEYINYFYKNFSKYKPKCYHLLDGTLCPGSLTKKNMRHDIKYSKNEWSVLSGYMMKKGSYEYKTSFKSRLFRFDCLGFFKNLKSRHMFRKLIRLLENSK